MAGDACVAFRPARLVSPRLRRRTRRTRQLRYRRGAHLGRGSPSGGPQCGLLARGLAGLVAADAGDRKNRVTLVDTGANSGCRLCPSTTIPSSKGAITVRLLAASCGPACGSGSLRSSRRHRRVAFKRPSKMSTAAGKPKFGLASTMRRSPPFKNVLDAISTPTASAPPPVSRRLPRGGRSRPPGGRTCRPIRLGRSSSSAAVLRSAPSASWAVPLGWTPFVPTGSFAAT